MPKKIILSFYFSFILLNLCAQSIPVSPLSLDDDLRFLQLQGKLSPDYSLTVRPLYFTKKFTADSFYALIVSENQDPLKEASYRFLRNTGKLSLLPTTFLSKFNSHHPYGWNDGAMIPAKGFQSIVSPGVYAELGPLAIQLKPEFLNASNLAYENTEGFGTIPTKKVQRFFPGQSSVRLNAGHVSLGISTENIYWGPGQFTSLMMSNNAPGFLHITFNSRKPLKTPIGSFEWQLLGGRLEDEKLQSEEIFNLKSYLDVYGNPSGDKLPWKYVNGMVLTYQPSFLKKVFIGFSRSFTSSGENTLNNLYKKDGFVTAYLPVIGKLFKSKLVNDDQRQQNQIIAANMRILFPKSHAEVYAEYGWNDHSYNIRDFLMSPFHSSTYMVGTRKMVELSNDTWLDFSAEINQMEQSPDYFVRDAGSWYVHFKSSNYANLGQVLGSGIGFGSNAQIFSASLRKGYDKIGLLLERTQRDPNTHYTRWTDLSYGITGQYKLDKLLVNWRLSGVSSNNYGWKQNADRFNFLGMVGLNYYW